MKTKGSISNAKYWLHKYEEKIYRAEKFLRDAECKEVDEFPLIEVEILKIIDRWKKVVESKRKYISN